MPNVTLPTKDAFYRIEAGVSHHMRDYNWCQATDKCKSQGITVSVDLDYNVALRSPKGMPHSKVKSVIKSAFGDFLELRFVGDWGEESQEDKHQFYLSVKQVEAYPETRGGEPGYKIIYPGGYTSWCPKETFERHNIAMGYTSAGDTINDSMVREFVKDVWATTMDDGKTTFTAATLANGQKVIQGSGCVDPGRYDLEQGKEICMDKIYAEVWKLLGFLLQTAKYGVNN